MTTPPSSHHTFIKVPFSRWPQGAPDTNDKLIQRKVEPSQEGKWEE